MLNVPRTLAVLTAAALFAALAPVAQAALVAYFPLDGVAGQNTNVIDDVRDDPSHPITDGTGNNSAAFWVDDPTRGSVLRTPDGNFFNAGTQGINRNTGFTWSFWVNVDSAETNSHSIIGTRNGAWHKMTTARGIDGTGFADFADGAYDLRDDQWHHVAYVGDTTSVRLYIDGVFIGQDTTTPATYNGNMQIGGTNNFSETVNALMDDIAIWDRALPLERIVALSQGAPVIPAPAALPAGLALLGLAAGRRRRR